MGVVCYLAAVHCPLWNRSNVRPFQAVLVVCVVGFMVAVGLVWFGLVLLLVKFVMEWVKPVLMDWFIYVMWFLNKWITRVVVVVLKENICILQTRRKICVGKAKAFSFLWYLGAGLVTGKSEKFILYLYNKFNKNGPEEWHPKKSTMCPHRAPK